MPTKFEKNLLEGLRDAFDHANGRRRVGRRVDVVQVPASDPERVGLDARQDDQDHCDD